VVPQVKKPRLREELLAELKNCYTTTRKTTDERVRIETESYLSYTVCDPDLHALYSQNPLLFWKDNGASYPLLKQLAIFFLGMSAGSVSVESMFSITGLILNSRRSSLDPSKLHKICFLHDNLKFVIDGIGDCDSDS